MCNRLTFLDLVKEGRSEDTNTPLHHIVGRCGGIKDIALTMGYILIAKRLQCAIKDRK
jgi:hypothetical protein